jgi:DHA1 family inner membrane transport protein
VKTRLVIGIDSLAPNGLAARVGLAILASAGILYANFSPVIVSGLAQNPAFTGETAGYVFSANMYGTAIGGFAIIFLINQLNWRWAAFALITLLICADVLSGWFGATDALYIIRFFHGLVGGALIGTGMSVIARTESPEVTIAFAIVIQLSLGGLGTAMLMPLLPTFGVSLVWISLTGLSAIALIFLPLFDPYPMTKSGVGKKPRCERAPRPQIFLALAALFSFQAGQMAAFAYRIELGLHYGFETNFVNLVIAVSLLTGAPSALIVAWWSTRSGRLLPACMGVVLMTSVTGMLLVPQSLVFGVASVGFAVFFAMSFPYLLGVASEMDNSGQVAAFGAFTSSLGLATGPAIAATLLGESHHERILIFACGALAASLLLVFGPARMLDRRAKHSRVVW